MALLLLPGAGATSINSPQFEAWGPEHLFRGATINARNGAIALLNDCARKGVTSYRQTSGVGVREPLNHSELLFATEFSWPISGRESALTLAIRACLALIPQGEPGIRATKGSRGPFLLARWAVLTSGRTGWEAPLALEMARLSRMTVVVKTLSKGCVVEMTHQPPSGPILGSIVWDRSTKTPVDGMNVNPHSSAAFSYKPGDVAGPATVFGSSGGDDKKRRAALAVASSVASAVIEHVKPAVSVAQAAMDAVNLSNRTLERERNYTELLQLSKDMAIWLHTNAFSASTPTTLRLTVIRVSPVAGPDVPAMKRLSPEMRAFRRYMGGLHPVLACPSINALGLHDDSVRPWHRLVIGTVVRSLEGEGQLASSLNHNLAVWTRHDMIMIAASPQTSATMLKATSSLIETHAPLSRLNVTDLTFPSMVNPKFITGYWRRRADDAIKASSDGVMASMPINVQDIATRADATLAVASGLSSLQYAMTDCQRRLDGLTGATGLLAPPTDAAAQALRHYGVELDAHSVAAAKATHPVCAPLSTPALVRSMREQQETRHDEPVNRDLGGSYMYAVAAPFMCIRMARHALRSASPLLGAVMSMVLNPPSVTNAWSACSGAYAVARGTVLQGLASLMPKDKAAIDMCMAHHIVAASPWLIAAARPAQQLGARLVACIGPWIDPAPLANEPHRTSAPRASPGPQEMRWRDFVNHSVAPSMTLHSTIQLRSETATGKTRYLAPALAERGWQVTICVPRKVIRDEAPEQFMKLTARSGTDTAAIVIATAGHVRSRLRHDSQWRARSIFLFDEAHMHLFAMVACVEMIPDDTTMVLMSATHKSGPLQLVRKPTLCLTSPITRGNRPGLVLCKSSTRMVDMVADEVKRPDRQGRRVLALHGTIKSARRTHDELRRANITATMWTSMDTRYDSTSVVVCASQTGDVGANVNRLASVVFEPIEVVNHKGRLMTIPVTPETAGQRTGRAARDGPGRAVTSATPVPFDVINYPTVEELLDHTSLAETVYSLKTGLHPLPFSPDGSYVLCGTHWGVVRTHFSLSQEARAVLGRLYLRTMTEFSGVAQVKAALSDAVLDDIRPLFRAEVDALEMLSLPELARWFESRPLVVWPDYYDAPVRVNSLHVTETGITVGIRRRK